MGVSNDTRAWFVRNRIVSLEMIADDLVDYFSNSDEVLADVLWPEGGFFDGVTLVADGNDKFKIGGLSGIDGAVGGDLLNLTDRQADVEGIQFENTNLADYHVGLQDARLPEEIVVNPKDGLPNWTRHRHIIGQQDVPDAVSDNGDGTITFEVDSLTETGVSNAGRQVYVFMAALPEGAITNAIAIELLTVAWAGGNNKITTADDLGQDTISTTAGDYVVILVGPHVLRNTDISGNAAYAYVGTVQGVGAGGPPTVFDVTAQRMLTQSTANLWQVLRQENVPPLRWKIDVKAIAGETGVDQIRVTDSGSNVKFSVDEAGNVVVEGDFEVKGTTTTRDVDQINTHNAYFDNFDAGNADTDDHKIQGEWAHASSGSGITAFAVDGDTGRVGIGGTYDGTKALKITGDTVFAGDLFPDGNTRSLGGPGGGESWKFLHLSAVLGEGVVSSLVPATTGRDLGSSLRPWLNLYLSTVADNGMATDLVPATIALDLGNAAYPWQNLYLGNLRFSVSGAGANEKNWELEIISNAGELLRFSAKTDAWGAPAPFFEALRVVDSTAISYLTLTAINVEIAGTLQPDNDTRSLGSAGKKWKWFYVSDAPLEGVATSLMPVTKGDLNLGSYDMEAENGYMWDHFAFQTGIIAHTAPSLRIFKEDQVADEGGWEFRLSGKNLLFQPIEDDGTPGADYVFSAVRGVGTVLTELQFGVRLVPIITNTYDLGESGTPLKWKDAFFSGTIDTADLTFSGLVSGPGFLADGDPGVGAANTITFTSVSVAPADTDARTVVGQGVGANQGYIKIYVANLPKYIPYWSSD